MSLFIGSIASHVRQEDLERVFRKFGSCSVQVKDTFGFVDYDYPVNAERALKMLRGKWIFGQLLSLSWSNRQAKPSPRARPVNFHESHHGRNFHESHHERDLQESHHGRNLRESKYGRNFHEPNHGKNLQESQHGRNLLESQHGKNLQESLRGRNFHESHHGKSLQEFQHGRNLLEPHHGRNLRESHHGKINRKKSNVNKKLSSKGQMGYKKPAPEDKVSRPTDKAENVRKRDLKNAEILGKKKKLVDAKGEEQIEDRLPTGNELKIASDFDRYEPYSSDDKRDHVDHRSQGGEYEKKKRIRERQSPENQRSESPSPERLRARKSRKMMSSPSRSDDKVSRSKSNSIMSKSTTKFATNSNSRSCSLSSSSRDHRSKSGSRPCSRSRASVNVSTSSRPFSTPPTKSHNGKNNSLTSPERNEDQIRSKSGSGSRSSSHASLNVSTPSVRSSTPLTKSPNGKKDSFTSSERNEVQMRSVPLVENGNEVLQSQKSEEDTRLPENGGLTEEVLSPTIHKGTRDLQICNFNISKLDSRPPKTIKSLCITSEELLMLIKHYGLKQPDGVVDKDLPVESLLGCARLWPSEIVNYRRLKKGSISTENYARRIFQNKAFGIVDRYVRSSSGWGEVTCTW